MNGKHLLFLMVGLQMTVPLLDKVLKMCFMKVVLILLLNNYMITE